MSEEASESIGGQLGRHSGALNPCQFVQLSGKLRPRPQAAAAGSEEELSSDCDC
jgi:hypothetical protein